MNGVKHSFRYHFCTDKTIWVGPMGTQACEFESARCRQHSHSIGMVKISVKCVLWRAAMLFQILGILAVGGFASGIRGW
jgi:hypothetical protein